MHPFLTFNKSPSKSILSVQIQISVPKLSFFFICYLSCTASELNDALVVNESTFLIIRRLLYCTYVLNILRIYQLMNSIHNNDAYLCKMCPKEARDV